MRKSPGQFAFAEMQAMGLARVSLRGALVMAAIQGMRDAVAAIQANGCAGGPGAKLADFGDVKRLAGFDEVFELEKRYFAGLQPATA